MKTAKHEVKDAFSFRDCNCIGTWTTNSCHESLPNGPCYIPPPRDSHDLDRIMLNSQFHIQQKVPTSMARLPIWLSLILKKIDSKTRLLDCWTEANCVKCQVKCQVKCVRGNFRTKRISNQRDDREGRL